MERTLALSQCMSSTFTRSLRKPDISGACCRRLSTARVPTRRPRGRANQACKASMGIGITPDDDEAQADVIDAEFQLEIPSHATGLTTRQMAAMGLVGDEVTKRYPTVLDSLTSKAQIGGEFVCEATRVATRMYAGRPPSQAPPDLPSLLLDGRICYIGMPLVPSVTELVISELLWLNYDKPEQPIYLYINSIGSQANGEAVGFETEAYAILDTMAYIRPEKYTLVVGQAFGNAAIILANGKKGKRYALPNSRIMLAPPRMNQAYGIASNAMIKANELDHCTNTYVDFLAKTTGREKEEVEAMSGRNKYFTPTEAIDFGLVDRVVQPEDSMFNEKDYDAMLAQSQAMQRRMGGGDEGPATGAE